MRNMKQVSAEKMAMGVRGSLVILAATILAMIVGCGKKTGATAENRNLIVGSEQKKIEDMKPGDVIVSVNGTQLKRAEFDDTLDVWELIYRLMNPVCKERDAKDYRLSRSRSFVPEYVTKQLLVQEARRRGLKATPEKVDMMENIMANVAKREGKTAEQFLTSLGRKGDLLRQDMKEQALIQTLRQVEFGEKLTITQEDIKKVEKGCKKYNDMCEATNRLVQAHAEKVVARLRAGADFSQVAKEVSQVKDGEGGFWGEFGRAEIDDAQIRHEAFTLPVGEFSKPIDTADGLVIIKVLERVGVDSPAATLSAKVKLARILFLLTEFKQLPDEKVIRSEVEKSRLESLQRNWLTGMLKRARVEYPNGTNFWGVVKKGK